MLAGNDGPMVNYQAIGSGSGRKAYLDQTVNFGASDDPMISRDRRKVKRGVVQIPMIGGTIAFGYNKPGCELKLTQEQAVKVAMSVIKDWSELGCASVRFLGYTDRMVQEPPRPSPVRWQRFPPPGP